MILCLVQSCFCMDFTRNDYNKNKEEYFKKVKLVDQKKTEKYKKILEDLEKNNYCDIDKAIIKMKNKLKKLRKQIREEKITILNDFKNECKCDERTWNFCMKYIQKIQKHENASRNLPLEKGGKYDERIPMEFLETCKKQFLAYGLHLQRIKIKCDETYGQEVWSCRSPYPMIHDKQGNINDQNTRPGKIIFAYPLPTCDSSLEVEAFCKHIAARLIHSDYILWNSFYRYHLLLNVKVDTIVNYKQQYYKKINSKDILWALGSKKHSEDALFYHRNFFESMFSIEDFKTVVKIKNYYSLYKQLRTVQKINKKHGAYSVSKVSNQ